MSRPDDLWTLTDLATPWAIRVAVTLRLADHAAAGAETAETLAVAAGCDPGALRALLRHLAWIGLFEMAGDDRFLLTERGRGLLEPGLRLGLDLDGLGGRFAHAWGSLLTYVRTGEPGYAELYGRPFFDDLEAHPELAETFDALIGPPGHGAPEANLEIAGGWRGVREVVDVGGGTGAMLAALLELHPELRATLVELPATAARARAAFEAAGVAERVRLVGGSFFDPLPAGADVYLLRGVVNDWPDGEAVAILRRCAEAARPAGRVVVLKSVVPAAEPERLPEHAVLVGGTNRTLDEFRRLASDAGLRVVVAAAQPSGYFVVECRPG